MTRRERGDRRPGERRDGQPDEEQQRRPGEAEAQEGDSLTALKAILAKVAGLLSTLQLTQDESISLVEQLYGSVLDMDVKLAGEADDRRKSSVLAHIQNTTITRAGGKIAVEYPSGKDTKPAAAAPPEAVATAVAEALPAPSPVPETTAPEPPAQAAPEPAAGAVAPTPPVEETTADEG